MNRQSVYETLKQYAIDNKIDFLAVYGSFYYKTQNEKSDIDLIIDTKEYLEFDRKIKIIKSLEKMLKRKVDLITPRLMISSLICGYVWRLREYDVIYGEPVINSY